MWRKSLTFPFSALVMFFINISSPSLWKMILISSGFHIENFEDFITVSIHWIRKQSVCLQVIKKKKRKLDRRPCWNCSLIIPLQLNITSLPIITHTDCKSNPPDMPAFWQKGRIGNKSQIFLWSSHSLLKNHYFFLTWSWVCFLLELLYLSNCPNLCRHSLTGVFRCLTHHYLLHMWLCTNPGISMT